ncbi:TonB-dependent receptor [Terricaulis silvestris]|uniref:Pesticin receptor n=1 Tax=Terricaulis silvestris TaxID=2686094 RepID=A0A6I6MHD4_9CAUL|nr:TonB-dependent receptor [Terricaulis silvestris]QGZ93809.1 Pesticin receptor [Terricaulis silvestris]
MAKYGALAGALLFSVSPLAMSAYAQEAGVEEEIVVTAQRRDENIQDVPIAVSVVDADRLEAIGATDLTGLNQLAPGLHVQNINGFFIPRIRGLGTVAVAPGLENSVAVYVDGVYYASQPGALLSLNNLDHTEVLKGPQGTLFGRNATGGLINVITRSPSQDLTGSLSASYGNYDTTTLSGYITGGILPDAAADLAVRYSSQGDGYGTNLTTGNDVNRLINDYALRSRLQVTPTDATTITLSADYFYRETSSIGGHPIPGTTPFLGMGGSPYAGGPYDMQQNVDPYSELEGGGASLTVAQDLGWARLTSISAYRTDSFLIVFDQDATDGHFQELNHGMQRDEQFSQEVMLQSNEDAHIQWTLGAYYLKLNGQLDPFEQYFAFFPNPSGIAITESDLTAESAALYGQATLPLSDRTNLTVGARYMDESVEDSAQTNFVGFPPSPLVSAERDDSAWAWRISLDHQLTDDILLYASYNRGYKSGGINSPSPTDFYLPEEVDAYEVGFKSQFFDRRAIFNAAFYYYDFQNLQVFNFATAPPTIINAAGAEMYGADFDFSWRATNNLSLSAGLSLIHHEFTDFPGAPSFVPSTIPPFGNTVSLIDASGNKLPFTPNGTLNLGAHYEIPTSGGNWFADVDYYYNDGWFGAHDNVFEQDAYSLVNAGVGWRSANDRWGVRLWGANLGDEEVATALQANAFSTLTNTSAPQTYGITLDTRF